MDPHENPPPSGDLTDDLTDDLTALAAWRSRLVGAPVAVARGDSGVIAFAENRLIVNADDFEQLAVELKAGLTFEPLPDPTPPQEGEGARLRSLDGAPRVGTLYLDGEAMAFAEPDSQLEVGVNVSSRAGAGTLAAVMSLQAKDVRVGLDVYGDWAALPATSSIEGSGQDAYTFPENSGRSGLVRAWQLIQAHRLLGGSPAPVTVGIIDRGFWFDPVSGACLAPAGVAPEFPGGVRQYNVLNDTARVGGPNPAAATWHGQGTAAVAVAPHGSRAGIAGAGGTVATPFLFLHDISARMVIQAVRLATAWGVDVLNMSFGTTLTSFLGINPFPESDYNAMFQWASDNGVVIVAAAGNQGSELPDLDVRPATRTPGVITVGALAAGDSDRAASFSNYGVSVDLWAPGDDVWIGPDGSSATPSTTDGTSFAAPIVAGAAAMVISLFSDVHQRRATSQEVRDILYRTAWRSASDPKVTAGLDAGAALWDVLGGRFRADHTEPNDTAEGAKALSQSSGGAWVPSTLGPRALSAYGDKDWWYVDVPSLSRMRVRLDAASYWGRPTVVLKPDDQLSRVPEEMSQTTDLTSWTIDAPIVPPGRYRIGVIGGRTVYDLSVTLSAATMPPDEWEANNSLATASRFSMSNVLTADLTGLITHPMGTYDFTLHPGDVDYLHVSGVPVAGDRTPEVQVGQADETVTVEVLDRNGRVLRRTTAKYYAGRLRLEPGSCYVRVFCDRPTRYRLTLTMMVDLTLPPLKIPVEVLPPWQLPSPLWLSGLETHYVITVDPDSPVVGLEVRNAAGLTLEVLGDDGVPLALGAPTHGGVRVDTSGLPPGDHVLRISRAAVVDDIAAALTAVGEQPRRPAGVPFTVEPVLAGTYPG